MIKTLESKLRDAEARQREREAALNQAQEVRRQGQAAETERQKREAVRRPAPAAPAPAPAPARPPVATQTAVQTPVEIASAWGLIGTWQLQCQAAVSDANPSYAYVVKNGQLYVDRDFSKGSVDSSVVTDVTRGANGQLQFVIHFTALKQNRQHLVVKSSDGRMRNIANKNLGNGEASVVDGKFTSNGDTTPWMTRCR